jgi:hypothetical protein
MRKFSNPIWISTLILLLAPIVYGEILDRIVAVIDDRFIITLSDVRKERAIQSALGENAGTDESIVDGIIERHLVDEQIAQFRDIEVPEDAVDQRLRSVQVPAGLSSEDLKNALIGEFRRREFMMERFQQFIRVSDEELRKYYDEVYAPAVRLRGERLAPFEEVTEAIRQNKILEKMNEEVGSWLVELRRRSVIEKIPN